jgi:hypothetical protein
MSQDHGQGIFTMEFINAASRMKSIEEAKVAAHKVVDDATCTDANRAKASTLVMRSRHVRELIQAMTNWSLSHQGLKVLR